MLSHRLCLAGLLALAPLGVCAETGVYDVSLLGLRIGALGYTAEETGGRYAAKGTVNSSALARALMDVEITTEARGRVDGNTYRPAQFKATEVKDGDTITHTQTYSGGVPTVTRTPPKTKPNKYAADAAKQAGTLDQMTTAFAMLRDRPRDLACKLDIALFDGERRHGIRYAMAKPQSDGSLVCEGEYRRLQGFKPKEMAEKDVWPFTVIYQPAGDMMRVTEIRVPTTMGAVKLVRR